MLEEVEEMKRTLYLRMFPLKCAKVSKEIYSFECVLFVFRLFHFVRQTIGMWLLVWMCCYYSNHFARQSQCFFGIDPSHVFEFFYVLCSKKTQLSTSNPNCSSVAGRSAGSCYAVTQTKTKNLKRKAREKEKKIRQIKIV